MKGRRILAIFKKQVFDTIKNSSVILQFIMFPILGIILTKTIGESTADLPSDYFITMFSFMYVGMSPAVAMSSIISEEKEKGSLQSLLMNNVKAIEYLLGTGLYVFIMCMIGTAILAIGGGYEGNELSTYVGFMALGILASMLLGSAIGIASKNQMSAHSITIPITIVIAFLPLVAIFNKDFAKFSKYLYSQQVHDIISNLNSFKIETENIMILAINIIVFGGIFVYFYRKKSMYNN